MFNKSFPQPPCITKIKPCIHLWPSLAGDASGDGAGAVVRGRAGAAAALALLGRPLLPLPHPPRTRTAGTKQIQCTAAFSGTHLLHKHTLFSGKLALYFWEMLTTHFFPDFHSELSTSLPTFETFCFQIHLRISFFRARRRVVKQEGKISYRPECKFPALNPPL